MSLPDGQLIEKAKAGDTAAYGELFNRYQSKIYNFAYSLIGNSEDAKDTAQRAFIIVYEALPRLAEISFSVYLHRTTRTIAFDGLKVRKQENDIQDNPQRAALYLRELQGMSYEEIAQVLEIPKNSIGALLARARVKFRESSITSQATAKELSQECSDMLPQLSAYLDDELNAREIKQVKKHLKGCPLCRLALEEQTEASKSYRGIAPLAPPAALATEFFASLDEAGAAELVVSPESGNDMTIEMPKLELEDPPGRPWHKSAKTWAIVVAGGGAIALGLFVGAYTQNGGTQAAKTSKGKAIIDTYDLGGGIQSSDVPIHGALEATKALERSLEPKETTETTTSAVDTTQTPGTAGETSETTTADPADSSTTPDTTAPPTLGGLSPASGSVVENENVSFTWAAVTDPSGVTYGIDIESLDEGGSWRSLAARTGLAQPDFNHGLGDTQQRWRVWAIDGAGNAGLKTDWYLIQRSGLP